MLGYNVVYVALTKLKSALTKLTIGKLMWIGACNSYRTVDIVLLENSSTVSFLVFFFHSSKYYFGYKIRKLALLVTSKIYEIQMLTF